MEAPHPDREGGRYITLRRGGGGEPGALWRGVVSLISSMVTRTGVAEGPSRARRAGGPGLFTVRVAPPPPLTRRITITPEILIYYSWAVERGYDGGLGDFLNECVKASFTSKGIEPVMNSPTPGI